MEDNIEIFCPKCNRMLPQGTGYCPICDTIGLVIDPRSLKELRATPLRIGRTFVTVAGMISLIGGVADYAAAVSFAVFLGSPGISSKAAEAAIKMMIILSIIGLISIIGSAFGWSAGMHYWIKENLRSRVIEITFLAIAGFLNMFGGIVTTEYSGLGSSTILLVGLPTMILSLSSLILTTFAPSIATLYPIEAKQSKNEQTTT